MAEAGTQNLGAEWARRNLDENGVPPMAAPVAAAPQPMAAAPVTMYGNLGDPGQPPAKRAYAVDGGELTTITVLSMREKGLQQGDLEAWFRKRPGYMGLQVNTRLDGLFVRFISAADAEQALIEANNLQYRAEWARRNLDVGKESELNTITVLGARDKGLTIEQLQQWFQQRPGYAAIKVNERIDGVFVKFNSGAEAAQAMADANEMQFRAEWARRNLDQTP
uniref:Uncharacterized protein n=2 Tax=Alexandrium monilatum TaxID=311494 RepID=A0A7S4QHG5_9DINO